MNGFSRRYGPWAVVTGASDGIGRAFAVELARRGLSVVVAARRRALLEEVAAQVRALGADCLVVDADLGSDAGVARLRAVHESLDAGLLVCAAGFGTSGAFAEADLAAEQDMLAVNCGATLALAHDFSDRLSKRGRGGIVLMGSLVGFQGVPRAAHYAATKAYVQTLAEGLRAELAPRGVDVISSAPGPVPSGFGARAGMTIGSGDSPETVARGTLDGLGRLTTVRPGPTSKLLGWSLAPLPRWARTAILARVMAGMTGG